MWEWISQLPCNPGAGIGFPATSRCYHGCAREAVTFTPLLPIYSYVDWGSGIRILHKETSGLPWRGLNLQPLNHKTNMLTTELTRPHCLSKWGYNALLCEALVLAHLTRLHGPLCVVLVAVSDNLIFFPVAHWATRYFFW